MNERTKNICNLTRYGAEIRLRIPSTVLHERNYEHFKEQQEALKKLKKDTSLEINEKEDKSVEIIDGEEVEYNYKIITIRMKT